MSQKEKDERKLEPSSRSLSPFAFRLLPSVLWVLVLGWIVFFNRLSDTGLLDETEPLFAEAARQMTLTGDGITPYFNGVTRFDKPPLIYWLMAIAYQTIGTTAFAARLPSALAGTVLVGFCFYTVRFLSQREVGEQEGQRARGNLSFGSQAGQSSVHATSPTFPFLSTPSSSFPFTPYLAAAILALNTQMLFFGRTGYSDMLLNLCFGGSLFTFFLGYCQPEHPKVQSRWYLAMAVLMALGVLTKGPVGIVLPGGIILLFLLCVGKLGQGLREMQVIRNGLIFLAIALPWYVLVWLRNGDAFVNSFFGLHNLDRFTNVVNDHRGPWYYHLLILAIGFLPWSMYLPAAITQVLRDRPWQQADRSRHLGLFALIWFSVVMGFFTLAVTKYFSYSLPAVPAGAILVALWWGQIMQPRGAQDRGLKWSFYASLTGCIAFAAGVFYSPNWLTQDPTMPNLGLRIQEVGLPWIGGGIWLAIALAGILLLLNRKVHWFWAAHLVGFAAFVLFFITPALGIVDAERQLPLRQIAQTITQVRQPNEVLLMASEQFEKPSLVFYSQQPIAFFDRPHKAKPYLEQLHQTADTQTALMVITPDALDELNPKRYQMIQTVGVYQLIRIPLVGAL